MTDRATVWALTINNPTPSDEEGIALARQRGWKVEGQLEKGEEGTLHYQLLLRTPQVRFSAVKKAFPRAHISVSRNTPALKTYVHKEETRVAELPTSQEKYPSMSKLWDLLYKHFDAVSSPPPPPGGTKSYVTHFNDGNFKFHCVGDDPKERQAVFMYMFDDAISLLIREGYVVETMAANPQVRSSWLKYHRAILFRSFTQTIARQTDMRSDAESSIVLETHNNADANQGCEEGLSGTGRDASSQSQDYEDGRSSTDERPAESTDSCFGEEDD